jgi:hypothetical protein
VPRWLGLLVYIQPVTLGYLNHISIDDSRARKVLGCVSLFHLHFSLLMGPVKNSRYQAQWGTAQAIRYTVDEVQSGRTGATHGLQLKAEYN